MENIGILEKVREKRKEETRLRSLANLKHNKVIEGSNLIHREQSKEETGKTDVDMANLAGMSLNTYKAARVIYNEGTEEDLRYQKRKQPVPQ